MVKSKYCVVEPGYYEDGKFGVRIENLVLVVKAKTKVMVDGQQLDSSIVKCSSSLIQVIYNLKQYKYALLISVLFFQHNFRNKGFLTFEPLTLVPMQMKMIDPSLLTEKEVK